jgi:non-canonical poly(A) RNA polymerase PAPD5/7
MDEDDFIQLLDNESEDNRDDSDIGSNLKRKSPLQRQVFSGKRQRMQERGKDVDILSVLCSDSPWVLDTMRWHYPPQSLKLKSLEEKQIFSFTPNLAPVRQLHEEIIAFDCFASPTEQEKMARSFVLKRIADVVHQKLWNDALVQPFGSSYTGLYLPNSDIDIVITCPHPGSPLRAVARALVEANLVQPGSMKMITKARIPLVKFTEQTTQYVVDISFNQESGVEGSDHIRELLIKYPALRPLLLVIKQFLKQRHLNEVFTGGLGSYALTLLIVNFLQLHPMVQYGWIKPEENLGVLLIEFFELYGKSLSYDNVGISILGRGRYYDKEAQPHFQSGSKPHLLSIEDPYNPENDVAKGSFSVQTVRQSFFHAYILLSSIITRLNSEYQPMQLLKEKPSAMKSILSAIIDVPVQTLYHREYIEQLDPALFAPALEPL